MKTSNPVFLCQPFKAWSWLFLPLSTLSLLPPDLTMRLTDLPVGIPNPLVISLSYKMPIIVSEPEIDLLSVTHRSQDLKIIFAFMLMSLHFVELNVRYYLIITYYIILSLVEG